METRGSHYTWQEIGRTSAGFWLSRRRLLSYSRAGNDWNLALDHEPIYGFYHEAEYLPSGATVVLGITERTIDFNGTPTNYVGTMVVVLDEGFQATWAWDAFDHLDVNRRPILGETADANDVPVNVVPNHPAVDWLHNKSVSWFANVKDRGRSAWLTYFVTVHGSRVKEV